MDAGYPPLVELIKRRIDAENGSIPFADYMNLALYAPQLGYYAGPLPKFGAAGDFVTAPEISPLYGRCLATWAKAVLGQIENATILEFGAGTGRLASALLQALQHEECLPKNYYILEVSADLRLRQLQHLREAVPDLLPRIVWLDTLPAEPLDGLVIANEVLDALPVTCFELSGAGLDELRVGYESSGFVWRHSPIDDPGLRQEIEAALAPTRQLLVPPYRSELNRLLDPWIAAVADCLRTGALLCIDYGYARAEYYHPQRAAGTLICHYRHRAHSDPLILAGLQDITTSVDFTAVAEAADRHGFTVAAYTGFADFLLASGLPGILEETAGIDEELYRAYSGAAKTFLLPGEMGDRFKVMLLTKNFDHDCTLQAADRRHSL